MISLSFDIATGAVRLSQPAVIKAGAGIGVPLQVTLSEAPGTISGISLRLGTDAAPPALLAAAGTWNAENATTHTATLDAGAAALVTFMTGKGPTQVIGQLAATIDGVLRVSPNFPVTVQPVIPAA